MKDQLLDLEEQLKCVGQRIEEACTEILNALESEGKKGHEDPEWSHYCRLENFGYHLTNLSGMDEVGEFKSYIAEVKS